MAKRDRSRHSTSSPAPKDSSSGGKKRKGGAKKPGGRSAWKLLDRTSSVAAGLLAREVSQWAWRVSTGRRPPVAGRHPEVDAKEAVAWAVVGGALVELVKLLVRRGAADYWVKSTGSLPPGMKPVKPSVAPTTTKEPAPVREPAPSQRARRPRRGGAGREAQ